MRIGGRFGGIRFAWARSRAAAPPLFALAVTVAVAAALIVGIAVALRTVEAHEVRAALAQAGGDRAVATVSGGDADALTAAVRSSLDAQGVHATDVTIDGSRVLVAPDAARVSGDDVATLRAALDLLAGDVGDAVGLRVQVAGGLSATLASIDEGLQTRRGPSAVAIALIGLLAAVVVGAVALEPVRARGAQSRLLRARGARGRSLGGLAAAETFVVSIVGAIVGSGIVLGAAAAFALATPGLLFAGIVALAVAVAATLVALVVTVRSSDARPSRARVAAFAGGAVVLAVFTALAAWRFAESGTPVVVGARGAVLDPLVAIAPALVLGLAAGVAVLVATPLTRLLAASVVRSRGVQPVTPLRLASRRPGRHALPITVVAFAIGTATIAAAYVGTVGALGDAPEALRVGADVRVATIPDTIPAADVAATATEAGAPTAVLARGFSAQASTRIPVVAIEGGEVGDVLLDAGGTLDPAQVSSAIRLDPSSGIAISGDTLEVTVAAAMPPPIEVGGETYQPDRTLANVRMTLVSDGGSVWEYGFMNGTITTTADGGATFMTYDVEPEHREDIALPAGATWSLLAVSSTLADFASAGGTLAITASSGGADLDLTGMVPAPGTAGAVTTDAGILTLAPTYSDRGNALLTRAIVPGAPTSAPVVLTTDLAASLSLAQGDTIDLEFDGPDFEASVTVEDVVPVLPGTPSGQGMLADLGTLSLLSTEPIVPNQVWIAADDPDAVAAALSATFTGPTVLVADPRQGGAAAATGWAFVLAAGGAGALALVVLWLRRTRTRGDARELALLAVLGLGRRGAVRVRIAEDLTALTMGVIGGIAAGVATAWLIVPSLVRAAYGTVPTGYPVPLVWPWLLLVAAVAVLTGVFALVISSVRAPRAVASVLREDE